MSIADKLLAIYTRLDEILEDCNTALTNQGVSTANNFGELAPLILSISGSGESGGGESGGEGIPIDRYATGEISVTWEMPEESEEMSEPIKVDCHSDTKYIGMTEHPQNCIMLRLENASVDGVITEATATEATDSSSSCTIRYYDAASDTMKSKKVSIEPYHKLGSGAVTGFTVTVSNSIENAETTTNGAIIRFDGNYYWGWDKP